MLKGEENIKNNYTVADFPIGFIHETSDGKLVLYDRSGVPMRDSSIDNVIRLGITEEIYNNLTDEQETRLKTFTDKIIHKDKYDN